MCELLCSCFVVIGEVDIVVSEGDVFVVVLGNGD